jgi:hypothetical protein
VGAGIAAVWFALAGGASGASHPTLGASLRVAGLPAVFWGKPITLSGHESLAGSQSVTLWADVWPFTGGFRKVAGANSTGNYSFTVKPIHATRYRVMVGDKTSPVLTVYALKRTIENSCNLCASNNTPGTHTLTVTAKQQAPPGPIAVHGPVYVYYGQTNGSTAQPSTLALVKTVRLHISGDTMSFSFSYTVHFPMSSFEFAYAACFKDAEAKDGFSLPGHHHCGAKTVQNGAYLG